MGLYQLRVEFVLNLLTMVGGEVGDGHVDVARQGIQSSSNHGKTDGLELIVS